MNRPRYGFPDGRRALLAALVGFGLLLPGALGRAADGPLVSLDAEDAYLPSVLKILAEKGGLNIVTGPGVTGGRLSIHLKDVPIDQAVNLVVRAAGLSYERIGNSILVADAKSLQDETGLSSYIVDLKFADATEVKTALKNLAEKIEVDRSGNRLIIVTSPRIIAEIRSIVDRLDRPAQQVMLEARVVEVSTDDLKQLGIDWDALNQQRAIFIEGFAESTTYQRIPNLAPWYPVTPGKGDLYKLNRFSRQAMAFDVALDLLIHEGNARVLANPKIATLNGHEASILIGERIPFTVTGVVTSGAGGGAVSQKLVEREEVGIKLHITPLINEDGYITTTINPEISSVVAFKGENSDLPVVSTRQASTTVRLKDGSSVIIGGLLSEERTHTVTKVPILGSIPGLGVLFQHQSTGVSKKDLVIEVTPHILPAQQ